MTPLADLRFTFGGLLLVVFVAMAVAPGAFTAHDPMRTNFADALRGPSQQHWFGADELGRDTFARVVYGTRVSMLIAIAALSLSTVMGTLLGLIAGYAGNWVDELIMRVMDVLLSFPGILLAIAIAAGLGPGTQNVALAMGVYSVPTFARLVRASTLSTRQQEFVVSARAIGATDARIVGRHILPNIVATTVVVQLVVRFGTVILSAAGLGFLGLGVQPPAPEWGQMISAGRSYLGSAPHLMLLPGAVLTAAVLAFNLFGEWIQESSDPRLRNSNGRRS